MTYTRTLLYLLSALALCAFIACGDDDGDTSADGSTSDANTSDANTADGEVRDSSTTPDASSDAKLPDASLDAQTDATNTPDASNGPIFVSGDVDGETRSATKGFEGAQAAGGTLQFAGWTGGAPGSDTWTLRIPNSVGNHSCTGEAGGAYIQWATASPIKFYDGDREGASCAVEVTEAAAAQGDFIAGTFSATLVNISNDAEKVEITNGEFRVRRFN